MSNSYFKVILEFQIALMKVKIEILFQDLSFNFIKLFKMRFISNYLFFSILTSKKYILDAN